MLLFVLFYYSHLIYFLVLFIFLLVPFAFTELPSFEMCSFSTTGNSPSPLPPLENMRNVALFYWCVCVCVCVFVFPNRRVGAVRQELPTQRGAETKREKKKDMIDTRQRKHHVTVLGPLLVCLFVCFSLLESSRYVYKSCKATNDGSAQSFASQACLKPTYNIHTTTNKKKEKL